MRKTLLILLDILTLFLLPNVINYIINLFQYINVGNSYQLFGFFLSGFCTSLIIIAKHTISFSDVGHIAQNNRWLNEKRYYLFIRISISLMLWIFYTVGTLNHASLGNNTNNNKYNYISSFKTEIIQNDDNYYLIKNNNKIFNINKDSINLNQDTITVKLYYNYFINQWGYKDFTYNEDNYFVEYNDKKIKLNEYILNEN